MEVLLLALFNNSFMFYFLYAYVIYLVLRLAKFIYQNFIRKRKNLRDRYGNGSWVLVTGATDGLGRCYCEEFAREGFNIILVSRSLDKLKQVSEEIQKLNKNIKTHYIAYDFNEKTDLNDYQKTFGELTLNFDISIVVNNVGANEEGYFHKVKIENLKKIINVNVIPQTLITKIFSDYLSARKHRSAIIDLSSFASYMPIPYISATYSATKSFNYFLSRALAEEYEKFNIDFIAVRLLFAATNMSKLKANGWFTITAEQSVKGVLDDLGYTKESYGHWVHKIQAYLISLVPKSFLYPLINLFITILNKLKRNKKKVVENVKSQ